MTDSQSERNWAEWLEEYMQGTFEKPTDKKGVDGPVDGKLRLWCHTKDQVM